MTEQDRLALQRAVKMTARRPGAVRELRYSGGTLYWTPPADTSNVSHYRIRLDKDSGAPNYEVPSGQTSLQLGSGKIAVVTALNSQTGIESAPQYLAFTATLPGATTPVTTIRIAREE